MTQDTIAIVESAWEARQQWTAETIDPAWREAVMSVLAGLNGGSIRVAEKTSEDKTGCRINSQRKENWSWSRFRKRRYFYKRAQRSQIKIRL